MTFEKALEAMKQGEKVRRKISDGKRPHYFFIKNGKIMMLTPESMIPLNVPLFIETDDVLADDWEIYEEPQKSEQIESYMSNAYAITVLEKLLETEDFLECARELNTSVTGVCNCIKFAIQTIKEQNQQELVFDSANLSQKELEEVQEKLKECKLEIKPEKKCECKCKDKSECPDIIKEFSISEDIRGEKEISIKFNLEPLIDVWNMNLTKWISV